MMTLKKCVATLASIATFAAAGSAHATLTNWYLDSDGVGGAAAVQVSDYVDLNGKAYINNAFTSPTTFGFQEAGYFNSVMVDSDPTKAAALHSEFTSTGIGNIATQTVTFTPGGLLKVFSASNTQIAEFVLVKGDGALKGATTLPNGTFSLIFQATSMSAGYFFDSAMNDLSADISKGLTFGFATTNSLPLATTQVNAADKTKLTNIYNAAFNPDVATVINNGSTELLISNNGQFRLAVPEPASLALAGLGLSGLAAIRRRKTGA